MAETDIKTFESLVYPLEMKPENFYPEAMCFTIKKRIGLTLNDVGDVVNKASEEPINKWNAQQTVNKQHEEMNRIEQKVFQKIFSQ